MLCETNLIKNMSIPTTRTKYPFRVPITEGLKEYMELGINGSGLVNNNDYKSWKYNRQFFTQSILTPSFNHQAIEWTNELWEEMESYWNNLGENRELDLIKWMRRFTNEIIFRISTGVKNNVVASYYCTLIPENNDSLSEKEKERIKNLKILSNQLKLSWVDLFILWFLTSLFAIILHLFMKKLIAY
jgi:hypothetical protein